MSKQKTGRYINLIIVFIMLLSVAFATPTYGATPPTKTDDIIITFWQSLAYPYVSGPINDIIKDFEKENPHIHINLINTGGYDSTYIKTMNLRKIPKDRWPDVVLIYDIGLGGMIMNNDIIPASKFMTINKSNFVPSAIDYYTVWGITYGLPFNTSIPVLYINETLAKEYGIDKVPKTLKEISNICTSNQVTNRAVLTFPLHSWIIEQLIAVEGIPLLNHDNGRTKPGTKLSKEAFTALTETFSYLSSLKAKQCLLLTSPKSWEEANQNFFDGKAIMLITSSSDKKYIEEQMQARGYQVSVHPMIGINYNSNTSIIGGAALYIVKKSYSQEKINAIREFLKYLTSYKAQKAIATYTGYLPANSEAWKDIYKDADKDTKTILEVFAGSGRTIASKGAVSPAMYKVRFTIENGLHDLDNKPLHTIVNTINNKIAYHIANTEAIFYKPHIILIASVSLLLLLLAYSSYLILIDAYQEYCTTVIWASIPVAISILLVTQRYPLVYSLGLIILSVIIGYTSYLLLKLNKMVIWSIVPLTIESIVVGYYLYLANDFTGLYIPSRIYTYMFTLLAIPLILSLSISKHNFAFLFATFTMSLMPLSFYTTYTTKLTPAYIIVTISSLLVLMGMIIAEKRRKSDETLFKLTSLRIGIGTAMLIIVVISVIPGFLYWKNIYDISSAIDDNTFHTVLKESNIDKQMGSIVSMILGNQQLKKISYNPQTGLIIIKGTKNTATVPAQKLAPFLQTNLQFYDFSLYDVKGNLIIGQSIPDENVSTIVRPLNSVLSQLTVVGIVYDQHIASFITSNFIRTTLFGYYPLILIFITVLLIFYLSSRRINVLLWEEIEAKTSEILAMENSLKEAYSYLQKEHELLMLLIKSIVEGHTTGNPIRFLMDIGEMLQGSSEEIQGYFIYDKSGSLIQSEVAVNVKEVLRKVPEDKRSSIVETPEGTFIVTKLSTGQVFGISLSKKTQYAETITDVMDAFASLLETFMHMEMLREKTEKMHTHILMALVGALDLKDPYTKGHSLHVAKAAQMLGKKLELDENTLSKLYMASILHDIGKISIPDNILTKPGRLTKEEYEIIKTHPVMGYKLLKPIEGMEEIAEIILYHHERCDGKGYPNGLTCDEIPMLSKIIAVADAFDAMVNRRVYRKALTLEEAKEEIERNLGTQFDKYIGSMFLEIADEVYKVITEDKEEDSN